MGRRSPAAWPGRVWDAPIFFPDRDTLAFAEHLLGIGIFTAPIIWLTGNPILAYGIAFLLSYLLAGSGMYLLARELTGRRDAAFLAGVGFAFAPMRALHVSHLQVLAWGWMPIALWGLHRYFGRRSRAALAVFRRRIHRGSAVQRLLSLLPRARMRVCGVFELASRALTPGDRRRLFAGVLLAGAVILVCLIPIASAYARVRQQYRSAPVVRRLDDVRRRCCARMCRSCRW